MQIQTRVFKLFIPQSNSLKARRRVLNSLKDRIKRQFNASVIEVEGNDVWQRADIAVAVLSNRGDLLVNELDRIEDLVASHPEALLTQTVRNISDY